MSERTVISYGTSGFCSDESTVLELAESVGRAVGLLAIRRYLKEVQETECITCLLNLNRVIHISGTWGVMVTSNICSTDNKHMNGIKVIDRSGFMISVEDEQFLENTVNDSFVP